MNDPAWRRCTLGDGIQLISGRHIPASGCNTDGAGMPYLTGPDDFNARRIEATKYVSRPDAVCEPGDVLLVVKGSGTGKMIRADKQYCISRQLMAIRSSDWSNSFLEHFIHTQAAYYNSTAAGLIPGISRVDILDTPISVPPFEQQRKIARILTTLDNLIEKTEALIAKYQSIKQGMMHDLFTRGVDSHGHLRPTPDQAPDLYKLSDLGLIPKDWDQVTLGTELKRIEQGWSPDCESVPAKAGQWGVLKTTAVVWDGFASHENKALPPHLFARPEYEVRKGDVLMTRGGPNSRVGVVAYVYDTQPQLMLSDKLYRIVPNESFDPEYLSLALASASAQTHLSGLKTGLAESQTNISQAIVRRLLVARPTTSEQRDVAARIRTASRVLATELQALKKLRSQKSGLMQDLLTGKVRVKVDEAEEVAVDV